MDQLRDLAADLRIEPSALLDIFLTAVLIYLVLRLIQGTRAVRLAIGAAIVYGVYVIALQLDLRLLSGILQTGAVVGLVALVVIFQPELRRGLDRIGRVGTFAFQPSRPMRPSGRMFGRPRTAAGSRAWLLRISFGRTKSMRLVLRSVIELRSVTEVAWRGTPVGRWHRSLGDGRIESPSAANRNCQPTNAKVLLFSRRLAQLSFQVAGRLVVSAVMGRPVYVQRNGLANVRLK